mmetsp:Transcript_103003/g.315117  ORF Transcript_103003/g.315117 Transcript_103003/m.315117 type:complete len:283 (-) Transcript_103003:99-947(-)
MRSMCSAGAVAVRLAVGWAPLAATSAAPGVGTCITPSGAFPAPTAGGSGAPVERWVASEQLLLQVARGAVAAGPPSRTDPRLVAPEGVEGEGVGFEKAVCPELQKGSFGICVEECSSDDDCGADNEMCCPTGCGRSCIRVADIPAKAATSRVEPAPKLAAEGEECNGSLPPGLASFCAEGLHCVVERPMPGASGICQKLADHVTSPPTYDSTPKLLPPGPTSRREPLPCDQACDVDGRGRHSCRARVLWVRHHPEPIALEEATALVNEECDGQCHCEAADVE